MSRTLPAGDLETSPQQTYCRYNAHQRRLLDFQLPDLQGRPFRLKDVDSELVLLDF